MKRTFYTLLLIGAALAAVWSCGDDEVVEFTKERLTVKTNSIVFKATDSGSKQIPVEANCQWRAAFTSGQWDGLSLTMPASFSDGSIEVTTGENTRMTARTATMTITSQSGKLVRTITITQEASEASITVTPEKLEPFIGEADSRTLIVTSNSSWEVSGMTDWCHVSPASGNAGETEVTISVDANPNESSRPATLVFRTGSGINHPVAITQNAPSYLRIVSTSNTLYATAAAGTYQIPIESNTSWVPKISEDSHPEQRWIAVEPSKGMENGTISVRCVDNTSTEKRKAVIKLEWSRENVDPREISIVQDAATLPVIANVTVSDINRTAATIHFSFASEFPVTRYGVCYTTDRSQEPTLDDSKVELSGSQLSGDIIASLSDLVSGRRYYVRAFAVSAVGTAYSETANFTTAGEAPAEGDNKPDVEVKD